MADRFFELDKNSFSRYLGRGLCLLVEISHSQLPQKYYLINNIKDVTIDGQVYQAYPFDVILPSQTEQSGTKITLSNINNTISKELAAIVSSNENVIVQLYIANIEDNANEKINKGSFELTEIAITNEVVTGTINIRNCLDINLGSIRYNKQLFPNLYL
jgi:phage-related protein